jgi:methylglutaconyl-CoA hydratase
MNSPALLVEQLNEATTILTLNRPERRNALTTELMESLCQTLQSLAGRPQRRIVILRGAGLSFCAGLDLHEAANTEHPELDSQHVAHTFETLADSPLVTIAAAHGAAYAGGAGLMASCDFVLAADDLQVCFPEVRRGLVPALAAAALRLRVRAGDLAELLLLGAPVSAHRALDMGLVDRVVRATELLAEAKGLAATLVKGAPDAVRTTKCLLRELRNLNPSQVFTRAVEFHKRGRVSAEAAEGIAAFRERREPQWPAGIERIE